MRQVHRITDDGFFVEDVILEDGEKTPKDCVEIQAKPGFRWPRWDGKKWVEGGGIFTKAEDGSVDPASRFDPVVLEDGSSVQITEAGKLIKQPAP